MKFVGGQAGERAVETSFDGAAGEEHRGGFAVVGAAAVFMNPAAEFAEGHQRHALVMAEQFQVIHEGRDAAAEF